MKLTVRLLLLLVVIVLLIATKISDFQTSDRNIFKNLTHAGYVDQVWFGALLKVVKNSETTTTATTTTTVTKTFDNDTKNKLNDAPAKNVKPNVLKVSDNVPKNKVNDNNNDGPAPKNGRLNVLKVSPPKLQQFLPSVWIYTAAHREVVSQNLI